MVPYWNPRPGDEEVDAFWSGPAMFAWAMVGLGFFFPLLWLAAAIMPFCFSRSLWVRRAAVAAAGAACCYLADSCHHHTAGHAGHTQPHAESWALPHWLPPLRRLRQVSRLILGRLTS